MLLRYLKKIFYNSVAELRFNVTWYWMFLINIAGIYILGPIITKFFLVRMASGKGLGMDAFIALIIGIITLILGLIFRS